MKKLFSKLMLVAMAATLFVACEDVPEPYSIPEATPAEEITYIGSGTLENPYTCADVIKYVQSLDGEESAVEVYVKGIVAEVTEAFSTDIYGNGTFTMSDDGTPANVFTAYRVLYLGNQKYSNGKTQIKAGDEVVVYGKVVNYRGNTPETVQGSAFLYSLNGVSEGGTSTVEGEPTGSGTLEDPFNSVAAIKYAQEVGDTESPKEVYIKGKVASITEQYGTQFGNATFTISDDGTANGAFTIYRALYLGNQKYTSGDLLKEKDDVIVCGKVTNYRGNTPETVQGSAYLYSLNGKTGGSVNPQPGGEVKKVTVAEFNTAAVSDEWYQLTGKVTNLKDNDIYGNFDLVDETGSVYVYGLLSEKGGEKKLFQDLVAAKGIKEGSTITIIGNRGEYNGKIEVMNAYFVSIEGGSVTPDPQPGDEVKTVTVAEFNAAEVSDVWYQLTGKVTNLKDNDIYGNFDLVDETGSVYVYGLLSEKGGAKKLFQELVAAKGIKEGSTITIIGNRGEYNGKIEVMNAYFVSIEGGSDNPNPGGGDNPSGTVVTSLTNGDFETWADGLPTGWKSASTASSATLSQSTDAHGGSFSVNVNGKETSNVRLATQEITLAAGTYVFSFYTKATTADAAQVRPGYVPVTDGKVGSYTYGDYATINNTGWTQVIHEFTLSSEATVCLIVMNPKKSNYSSGKDVLVDDATLTKK
ncbi:MAG: carbohydrate binding domain-containing protein [Prevotella sp.]|nr:carbohydrate binding domain-containing protein [Prevotella sp.]